jgi:hypothetical protein
MRVADSIRKSRCENLGYMKLPGAFRKCCFVEVIRLMCG